MSEQASPGWHVTSKIKRTGAMESFEVAIDDPDKAIDVLKQLFQDDGTRRIYTAVEPRMIVALAVGRVRKI